MRSLPPRGSGWVPGLSNAVGVTKGVLNEGESKNPIEWQWTTHPLPRGGTDFIPKLHQYCFTDLIPFPSIAAVNCWATASHLCIGRYADWSNHSLCNTMPPVSHSVLCFGK